jgi:hypothetical protein
MVGVIAIIAFAPVGAYLGSSRFPDEEYRLTFTRPDGRPVAGVDLRVQTRAGGRSYLYPINEYLPDYAPTSDAGGTMVFHHVSGGIEFDTCESFSLIGLPLGIEGVPQYDCVFLHDGREVHRMRFDSLRHGGKGAPSVARKWRHSDRLVKEMLANQDRWDEWRNELFDGNRDGKLDLEESTSARYFMMAAREGEEEIVFAAREHAIVIADP